MLGCIVSSTTSVCKPVYKLKGLDQTCQNWSKVVNLCQTGDFVKIDGFEVVGDVNWIIDKSWQVVFRIVQNCQKLSILTLLDQISSKSSILTILSDLVTTWMSTESSTKVDRFMSKLIILVKSVEFSWFWSKLAKIVNFDDLRVSRSLMNLNRNCQNWRFRQFWPISWKFDGLEMSEVSKLTILGKSDNLHGDSLGIGRCWNC